MSGKPEVTGVETAYSGWARILNVEIALPDGSRVRREVEDHGSAAGVLPYDPERRVALLVRQLRAPMLLVAGQVQTLECIAGLLDDDAPDVCARREAHEEAGVRLDLLEPVVVMQTMPGISTELVHLFLAPYAQADKVGAGGGLAAEDELTEPVELPLTELARMADHGEVLDGKTLVLVQTLRLRRPDLFGA